MCPSPGSGPPSSPYLSLAFEEMQQEQERHKWRVIRGSVMALGGVILVMLVVIVRLLFAESVSNVPPSTLQYRRHASADELSERANASRFADVGGDKREDHYAPVRGASGNTWKRKGGERKRRFNGGTICRVALSEDFAYINRFSFSLFVWLV
ncbi:hypothetical protein HPB51_015876 [Rhipicephalus microplus]|uniref:Transmembrane protein n=1 Tax=Rhipicephalus microplus TaxID=6941 RepID=A0A9J6DHP2_RHIMP|nr:hypothetical protein HPB51_015876 [Rhipicephalus microplus]